MACGASQSMATLIATVVTLLVMVPSCSATLPRNPVTGVCDFRCWVENMSINIPPIEFLDNRIVLHNGTCDHISFDRLDSHRDDDDITLFVTIKDLAFNCSIPYTIKMSEKNLHHGYFTAKLLPTTSFGLSLKVIRGSDHLADGATTTVQSNLHLSKFSAHGDHGVVKWVEDLLLLTINFLDGTVNGILNDQAEKKLPPLIDNALGSALTEVDGIVEELINTPTTYPTPPAPEGSINWNDSPTIKLIDFIMNDMIGVSGKLSLNRLLDFFVTDGVFALDLKDKIEFNVPNFGSVVAGVKSIKLGGLDTWDQFDILEPVGNHSVKIQTGMTNLDFTVNFFVQVDVKGIISSGSLYEEGSLRLNLTGNKLDMEALFAFSEEYADHLNITVLNPGCLEAATKAFNITKMALDVTVASFELLPMNGDLEQDIDQFVTNVIMLLVNSFGPVIPKILTGFLSGPVRTQINTGASDFIGEKATCSRAADPFQSVEDQFLITWIVYAVFFFLSFLIIAFAYCKRRSQSRKGAYSSINDSSPLVSGPNSDNENIALAFQPDVPYLAKVLMPIFIMFGIVSFISANTANGAVVDAFYTTGNVTFNVAEVFSFTLANSVHDMYVSGVYPLAFVIAAASGMWPYLKLLLTLMCWYVSPLTKLCGWTVLPRGRRERILRALDLLGKWSLIDAFVLTLMVTAFRIHVQRGDSAAIDLFVFPEWGIFGFVMATVVSLIISHVMLHYHRAVEHRDDAYREVKQRRPLRSLGFTAYGEKFKFPLLGQAIVVFLLISSIVLICYGSVVESFRFIFTGIASVLFEAFDIKTVESYSLLSLAMDLPNAAQNPSDFGIHMIQVIVIVFAFIVPIIVNLLLIALWLTPMSPLNQRRLLSAVEVTNAWAMLEVFILAIIVALTEIKQFAAFIVGSKCDDLQPFLNHLAPLDDGDSKCFSVAAKLDSGCWYLFTACVLYICVGLIVIEICTVVLHDIVADRDPGANSQAINQGRDAQGRRKRSCGIFSTIAEKLFMLFPAIGILEHAEYEA